MNETFRLLLGSWAIERSIENHLTGESGSFHGVGTFTDSCRCSSIDSQHARYSEVGDHHFGGRAVSAQRQLEYICLPNNTVRACFVDGRTFYEFDLTGDARSYVHHCGADRYQITYLTVSDEIIRERWRVKGPNKSYDALTTMTRINTYSSASI